MMDDELKLTAKLQCLEFASRLILKDANGEKSLTKDHMIEAAKAFYEFINAA